MLMGHWNIEDPTQGQVETRCMTKEKAPRLGMDSQGTPTGTAGGGGDNGGLASAHTCVGRSLRGPRWSVTGRAAHLTFCSLLAGLSQPP